MTTKEPLPLPAPSGRSERERGIPRKLRGEKFSEWWQRISEREAIGVTVASRFTGITPQSVFNDYARFEDPPE